MNKNDPPTSVPILAYRNPPRRRGSLALANLAAIAGMFLGVIGFICVVGGLMGLLMTISNNDWAGIWPVAIYLILGFGICALAFWLCRSVYGIANDG